MSQRLALIIGNSEFKDPTLTRLVTPGEDAADLAAVLRHQSIGHFDQVDLLINRNTSVITRAIAAFYARKKRDDLLLLYFSGHGVLDERGDLYLAAKDTEVDLLSGSAVAASFITREMDRSRSRRQVLILDCCHSGAFSRGAKGTIGTSVQTATTFKGIGYGRVVLTASDATQYAWEGAELTGNAENSVFTHYLVEGLRTGKADVNQNGKINIDELYDYVYNNLVMIHTSKQTPHKWSYGQEGEIIIARNQNQAELERLAAEKTEAERKAKEKAEAERLEKERAETALRAAEKREAERQEAARRLEEEWRTIQEAEAKRKAVEQARLDREAILEPEEEHKVVEPKQMNPEAEGPTIFVPTPENEKQDVHSYISEVKDLFQRGKISRRQFIYIATLLGGSFAAALAVQSIFRPAEPELDRSEMEPDQVEVSSAGATNIFRGGKLTKAMQLQFLEHPARLSWVEGSNIVRQIGEYLTETDQNNITRPMLLQRWRPSDDLKTWTLYLRQGIKFNNGDEMTADDVMFTIGEWLDPDIGSSMLGLLSYIGGMQNVEKVDDYTIRLHLDTPNIGVPEHLFHYPAIILHRDFEGDIIRQPVGTGAFILDEYAEGERAVFRRRNDYWRIGADGDPLPYLDEIEYVSVDKDAGVAALKSGQLDSLYEPRPGDFLALKDIDDLTVRSVRTAQARVLRMRVDLEPWDDIRVRNALKMCQDRAKIMEDAYFGEGDLAIDAHVAPFHPAYCEKPIPAYDPEGARALLEEYAAEKGIELPLQVNLASKNDQNEPEIANALKELAEPAGFDITLDLTEPNGYWDRWTEVDLGITSWTHRQLATMILAIAYTEDAIGLWNETRWTDPEFETLLREAEREVDVAARQVIMCQIEDIMQERGPIGISFWLKVWNITRSEFQNVVAHPSGYDLLYEVWKDSS